MWEVFLLLPVQYFSKGYISNTIHKKNPDRKNQQYQVMNLLIHFKNPHRIFDIMSTPSPHIQKRNVKQGCYIGYENFRLFVLKQTLFDFTACLLTEIVMYLLKQIHKERKQARKKGA